MVGLLDAAIVLSDGSRFYDAEKIGEEELVVVASRDLSTAQEKQEQLGWVLRPEPCDARRCLASRLAQRNRPLVGAAEIEHAGLQMGLCARGLDWDCCRSGFLTKPGLMESKK
jgi:DNA-binding transcriptional LysR family regulator